MNLQNMVYEEQKVLHDLRHYLPAQNPLKDFVHHNTLHAFQEYSFHDALYKASATFGFKTYLPLEDYRERFQKKEILESILHKVIASHKAEDKLSLWKENLLQKKYDESTFERIGKLRANWKKEYSINLDKATHSFLFRVLCGYLDQGISIWNFPVHNNGFLASIKEIEGNSIGFFKSKRVKNLLKENASIKELLDILVGDESLFYQYIFDQQFSHPGWSGMVSTLENNPDSLLDKRQITLQELIQFELLLEIDALDKKFNQDWQPLASRLKERPLSLFELEKNTELHQVYALWQEAFEWSYYDEVLSGLQKAKTEPDNDSPSFQAMFCMDDREISLRRHIEHLDSKASTFGTAAFFNFEFYYQPIDGKFYTKLCPGPITPKYLIKEKPRKTKKSKDLHYHKQTHSLLFGWVISQTLGFASAIKLFTSIFRPSLTPATSHSFEHLNIDSRLKIVHKENERTQDNLQLGYTIVEMADRVEGLLKSVGLTEKFAPLVYLFGHGATSVNNTHYAGYDCGACCGRPSSVNARVACFAANHPEVRKILKERGLIIPEETQFVPGLHDTTRDEIRMYKEDHLSAQNAELHNQNLLVFEKALLNNAQERSRRFDTINSKQRKEKVHKLIKRRSVSLFEPRPELNHATNALCVVGRRELSKNLFLDRRSFMNSYDYRTDPTGDYLVGILGAVAPVGGGINLEYYFSRVDNQKLGAGSKLPHNVMGLIGVANGVDGDLRPGLPSQMIEVHDPIRLLVIVEHYLEKVEYAISKNASTYQWFKNQWVNLIVIEPETKKLFQFNGEEFLEYSATGEQEIHEIKDELSFAVNEIDNLPVYIFN